MQEYQVRIMRPGTLLCLVFLSLLVTQGKTHGSFEDFSPHEGGISPERLAQFYTDSLVQSGEAAHKKCSEKVFKAREKAVSDGRKPSLGVQPTVGLGAALLIFLGVGTFAVGIAQAFQMVS